MKKNLEGRREDKKEGRKKVKEKGIKIKEK